MIKTNQMRKSQQFKPIKCMIYLRDTQMASFSLHGSKVHAHMHTDNTWTTKIQHEKISRPWSYNSGSLTHTVMISINNTDIQGIFQPQGVESPCQQVGLYSTIQELCGKRNSKGRRSFVSVVLHEWKKCVLKITYNETRKNWILKSLKSIEWKGKNDLEFSRVQFSALSFSSS